MLRFSLLQLHIRAYFEQGKYAPTPTVTYRVQCRSHQYAYSSCTLSLQNSRNYAQLVTKRQCENALPRRNHHLNTDCHCLILLLDRRATRTRTGVAPDTASVFLLLGGECGSLILLVRGLLGEVFPFSPAVEVDEGLHATPFHDFALKPDEVDWLFCVSVFD